MLEPELFSAVARSGTLLGCSDNLELSIPADLTDNFNNMLLSGFKCSLKTYVHKLSFAT